MKARNNLLLHCYIVTLLIVLISLTACGGKISENENVDVGEQVESQQDSVNQDLKTESDVEQAGSKDDASAVYFLNINGETFEIGALNQEELTAYDVLNLYSKKQNVKVQTKKYGFGIFIEGIGEKIGDSKNFWIYYVNDKLATASADKTVVSPGDIVRFEFTKNSPF